MMNMTCMSCRTPSSRAMIGTVRPLRRKTQRVGASALLLGTAAITLLASVHISANAAEDSTHIAQEQHACSVVLGLDPSERPYDICIRSLSKSVSEAEQIGQIKSARRVCAAKGLNPGTSAFATCVVRTE